MRTLSDLASFARTALGLLRREKDLAAFEVYCSSAEHRVARLNYTSDIPSRGVEEFKSLNADGFAIRIVTSRDEHETGYASVAGDLSPAALRDALARARRSVIVDPHFPGLPSWPTKVETARVDQSDLRELVRAKDAALAETAWQIVSGAIKTFEARAPLKLAHPGLILGGDLSLIRDRIAIGNSAFQEIRTDESAHFVSSVTVLVEALAAKGTATAMGCSLDEMRRAGAHLGREAVTRALELRHGERPEAGDYRVLLGAQPLAEIVNYIVLPSLTTGAFHAASSAYQGRFGASVMDQRLSLLDDPLARQGLLRRRITCEGIPAARTELIRDGRLTGLLSNFYDTHKLLRDERRREKLGASASEIQSDFPPHSGYRLGDALVRRFDAHPSAAGTNVIMRARDGIDEKDLIAAVGNGLYIGRVWYTYPINGPRAGDFTCTVSGDSYIIRNGKIAAPLAPNCLRINANIEQVFVHPLAVGRRTQPAVVWGSAEAYFVPAIVADRIALAAIGSADLLGNK